MHVHEVTDPVPGTMTIVDLVRPDGRPGNGIEQWRRDAPRKACPRQGNNPFEHSRAVLLLSSSGVTNGDHAGNVGGAPQVLTTRVDQQQAITFDTGMRLLRGAVMRHGAIGIEGSDGRKTQRDKTWTTRTCGTQLLVNGQFGD
ncbi:hypothetical protein D3C76_1317710 [compost metagenome]